eukprot:TRINITY_DN5244_c0_g1_i1.p1 TRINITY_DN5244_c0_g1~~TRINITY_DN5244_c0_g1_i1.p1  ORF type:complete len:1059 (-),score=303.19 TRINITY_DN5244_c0_g1_i1:16-3192(-)
MGKLLDVHDDSQQGNFIQSWTTALEDSGLETVDVTSGFDLVLSVKDSAEINHIKTAATISSAVMNKFLVPKMETIIDEGKTVTHAELGAETEELFNDPTKISSKLQADLVDYSFPPMIQSGGEFNFRIPTPNSEKPIDYEVIICFLGARYKSYCSAVARTFLIDPKPEQTENYNFLLQVHQHIVKSFKTGNSLSKLMESARAYIEKKKPELLPHFVSSCGTGMGIELVEKILDINSTNEKITKEGMVFHLLIGFENLKLPSATNPRRKTYSLALGDTVLVTKDELTVFTSSVSSNYSAISYSIESESNSSDVKDSKQSETTERKKLSEQVVPEVTTRGFNTRSKERTEQDNERKIMEEKRKVHQLELARRKQEEAEALFLKQKLDQEISAGATSGEINAYDSPQQFPPEAKNNMIHVDPKRESVLLPIFGFHVPFHITTIKSVSKSEEVLRIILQTPVGINVSQTNQPNQPTNANQSVFIREMTFRCPDVKNLNNSLRMIKEVRKRVVSRNLHNRDLASIKKQEELILNKQRPPRLANQLFLRTAGSRRLPGALEAHKNGFRFIPQKGNAVDILYKNIKHPFFQPAENELIVIIHFHLRNAIMIGQKKTVDVQFYSEVMNVCESIDGSTRDGRMHNEEVEEELRERAFKDRLNNEFQVFVKKVEDSTGGALEFDIPFRELGFYGVPSRSNIFLQPTQYALVHLVEPPFFVLTLDEVEIAHFERIQFTLKNFDLVFIHQLDLKKPVIRLSAIPVEYLDNIKGWLDSCNIKYYEGPTNLNWERIMSTIQSNPKSFFQDGGWSFLENPSDDSSDSGEESEDYNPGEEEEEDDGSDDSSALSSDDSDASDDADMTSESGSGSEEEEEEEETGMDWDDLEKEARKDDRARIDRLKGGEGAGGAGAKKRKVEDLSDNSSDDDGAKKKAKSQAPSTKRPTSSSSNGGGSRSSSSSASNKSAVAIRQQQQSKTSQGQAKSGTRPSTSATPKPTAASNKKGPPPSSSNTKSSSQRPSAPPSSSSSGPRSSSGKAPATSRPSSSSSKTSVSSGSRTKQTTLPSMSKRK